MAVSGKHERVSAGQMAQRVSELAARIDLAAIGEMSKVNPCLANTLLQQAKKDVSELQQQYQQQSQQQPVQTTTEQEQETGFEAGKPEDEVKSEKELALNPKLPFQSILSQIKNLETRIAAENAQRLQQASTPTPSR